MLLLPATWAILATRRLEAHYCCSDCVKTLFASCHMALDATQADGSHNKLTGTASSTDSCPLRSQHRRGMSSVSGALPVAIDNVCKTQHAVQQHSYSRQPRYSIAMIDIQSGNEHKYASDRPDDSSQNSSLDHTDITPESPAAYVRARYRSMAERRQQVAHVGSWSERKSSGIALVDRWANSTSSPIADVNNLADNKSLDTPHLDHWPGSSSSQDAHVDRWSATKSSRRTALQTPKKRQSRQV